MEIAILGAGQLARMLALEAHRLGLQIRVIGPEEAPCGADVSVHHRVDLNDAAAAVDACRGADLVTYEMEHLPLATVEALAGQMTVSPNPRSLQVSQDRLFEKQMFAEMKVETAPYQQVDSLADVSSAIECWGYPILLKTRRDGFDGRGQRWLRSDADLPTSDAEVTDHIAEAPVKFRRELSVVAVRNAKGEFLTYPLTENRHNDNILSVSRAPARGLERSEAAVTIAQRVAEHLDYVGVLAIELFEVDGRLVANEMAPRVHNSGHWTLDGAVTSQFENHLRAIAGLPLGSTETRGVTIMANLIGTVPPLSELLSVPEAKVHLYGKAPRPKRKIGHISGVAAHHEAADVLEKKLVELTGLD